MMLCTFAGWGISSTEEIYCVDAEREERGVVWLCVIYHHASQNKNSFERINCHSNFSFVIKNILLSQFVAGLQGSISSTLKPKNTCKKSVLIQARTSPYPPLHQSLFRSTWAMAGSLFWSPGVAGSLRQTRKTSATLAGGLDRASNRRSDRYLS